MSAIEKALGEVDEVLSKNIEGINKAESNYERLCIYIKLYTELSKLRQKYNEVTVRLYIDDVVWCLKADVPDITS